MRLLSWISLLRRHSATSLLKEGCSKTATRRALAVALGSSSIATIGQAQTGDSEDFGINTSVDNRTFKILGAVTRRSLRTFFGEMPTLRDYGALGNGSADDTRAMQTATQAAGASKLLTIRSGTYRLTGTIYTPHGGSILFENGSSVTGGAIVGLTDESAVQGNSGLALTRNSSMIGNENTLFVSGSASKTQGTIPYQKNGIYARIAQGDRSDYSAGRLRDFVGIYGQADIAEDNLTGRVWGLYSGVNVPAGANGYAVGLEIGLNNNTGIKAGPYGSITAKLGLHIVASGDADSTAAIVFRDAGALWQDGILCFQSALTRTFLRLIGSNGKDVFHIDKTGNLLVNSVNLSPDGKAMIKYDEVTGKLFYSYNGSRLWSIDQAGNMVTKGIIVQGSP